jgi:hypothetical protein
MITRPKRVTFLGLDAVDCLLLVVGIALAGLLLFWPTTTCCRRAMSNRHRSLNLRALPTRQSPSRKTAGCRSSGRSFARQCAEGVSVHQSLK